ncbi:MAG TPA: 3-phosphoshikimate 1-carboxyvinyltransferase [Dehalococcoidia bacterium]|jgi:3-phosphoshikimate 1-carboxyvinyltransferase|nr:3-phosphoshikimate 1-carboxyvinyltransferase [Chloroflexota bacterium]MDP5876590.1 3-phosphoshikimate 1-carboxyvinyltransferase [Dehalococcoidia bacterium]MDP6273349.1 3-phosphoshikimate 1-carboxyvinyltransferase [Dehalococcoidia bacterium]MDP7161517.1 3-phosphoshikimate 1-carboxyvinyltransferase [Dehalococcoidia bacterium]MDP7213174.1 3-phosphoshikimate 1-carboxyvinyltransferase [Dehalococcoidia bacterium]|tara:strand:- start:1275 stop:2582 length:1308 start_codon:yes stop_codon:yes gene_type:complete
MAREVSRPKRLRGAIEIPGDKSISHRAVMFNAIANGSATVTNLSGGADCTSTIGILRAMGVEIQRSAGPAGRGDTIHITGVGMHGLAEPIEILDAGNSGTTTRLMCGLLAGRPIMTVITGDDSLRSRPMGRVINPLRSMGAEISARGGGRLAPIVFHGGDLHGIEYDMPVASAQLKSCLLLAGLRATGSTVINQPDVTRDHTERILAGMGAVIEVNGLAVTTSASELSAADVEVPGDVSSAAFWIVAAAAHPDADITLSNVGINPTRTGIFQVLGGMGVEIEFVNQRTVAGEPVADLHVRSSDLKGVDIGGDVIPLMIDEVPVVAVAAAMAEGTTKITEAAELRVKESDRISATVAWLKAAGVEHEEAEDGLTIHGGGRIQSAVADSFDDHRIAMSLAIAGVVSEGTIGIERAESVDISYPTFWRDLNTLSGVVA